MTITDTYKVRMVDINGNPLITSAVATEAKQDASNTRLDTLHTDLAGLLARWVVAAQLANGIAIPVTTVEGAANLLSNGTTFDLALNNIEGIALTSAARTTTANSADIITYNARGICIYLDITTASGTGGLTVNLQHKDPASAKYSTVFAASAAVITAVTRVYLIGQGNTSQGNTAGVAAQLLARTLRIQITVGDASSYTYSVGYCLSN